MGWREPKGKEILKPGGILCWYWKERQRSRQIAYETESIYEFHRTLTNLRVSFKKDGLEDCLNYKFLGIF